MKTAWPGLLSLGALLVVPFALRPPQPTDDGATEIVVVITPHNEAIRYEFSAGFRRHMHDRGKRKLRIDWRNPGGSTEITRFLSSEYRAAFEAHWRGTLGREFSDRVAKAFANPKQTTVGEDDAARARREFLASRVGVKADVLFGGGSFDFSQHAAAGRLVDSGFVAAHPELFNEQVIPESVGGEPYWDRQGRWVGACVSGYGICYSPDALARLRIPSAPRRWSDLTDPRYRGQIALADPTKSGSATKAFEMLLQQSMAEAVAAGGRGGNAEGAADPEALGRGFDAGLRLIRKIAANTRYFTDAASKVPLDVASGNAAAGMCIDFYGRFQNDAPGAARLRFVTPEGGSSMGSDPIGLLRGAPSEALGRELIEYVLSPAGQALWAYKRGVPGGPELYPLRRLPILPQLYRPELAELRSDPDDNPYRAARSFTYHAAWTGPLFRAIGLLVRVMCIDTEPELHEAWAALIEHEFPPRARAAFDDVSNVSYALVQREILPTLAKQDPLAEVELGNRLLRELAAQYREVTRLARGGT